MPQIKNMWNTAHITQCRKKWPQAMLNDEHSLASYRHDFGKIIPSHPVALFEPPSREEAQSFIRYAWQHELPITLRGYGLSQSGQSLAGAGGLILNMNSFNQVSEPDGHSIWIDAHASWRNLMEVSLKQSLIPYVVPLNCNLSVGGVISAGGMGASSFKYGSVVAHIEALDVLKANGELVRVERQSPLMQACLGGQGRFGLITQACVALRPCAKLVRTFFLVYLDKESWLHDLKQCQIKADYLESFCTPAVQGTRLVEKGRIPFAQWLYALHVTLEYDEVAPALSDLRLSPFRCLHTQDESIHSWVHRHDGRFNTMKRTGQWDLAHPWYECFISCDQLDQLEKILEQLPLYYATTVHVAPIKAMASSGFLQLPAAKETFALMILNPGISEVLLGGCLDTIQHLDAELLPFGGKRYLSGYLGASVDTAFWEQHFGEHYKEWIELKQHFDPRGIFCSVLHPL